MLISDVAFVTMVWRSFRVVFTSLSALFIGKNEIDDLHLPPWKLILLRLIL